MLLGSTLAHYNPQSTHLQLLIGCYVRAHHKMQHWQFDRGQNTVFLQTLRDQNFPETELLSIWCVST